MCLIWAYLDSESQIGSFVTSIDIMIFTFDYKFDEIEISMIVSLIKKKHQKTLISKFLHFILLEHPLGSTYEWAGLSEAKFTPTRSEPTRPMPCSSVQYQRAPFLAPISFSPSTTWPPQLKQWKKLSRAFQPPIADLAPLYSRSPVDLPGHFLCFEKKSQNPPSAPSFLIEEQPIIFTLTCIEAAAGRRCHVGIWFVRWRCRWGLQDLSPDQPR